ncbi:MAG: autotransporter-associated beta strand repeat-containing protein, partial [Pirellulales bacterium]|nr:autotransporter-associated beta strand repeat-containing protein [Pirellulales bacterium]
FLTPVKNQWGGTCWAHADVGVLEAKYKITRNDPNFSPDLSEQQLVWETDPDLGSMQGGDYFRKAMNYFCDHGVVSEAECPKQETNVGAPPYWPLADGWEDRVWKAESCWNDIGAIGTAALKEALKKYGPMVENMSVDDEWYDPAPGSPRGGHAVLIVGFQDDASAPGGGYWIVKNSWGPTWNGDGYGAIAYANRPLYSTDTCTLTGAVYYTGSMATATWKGGSGTWREWGSYWTSGGSNYYWQNQETSAIFTGAGGTVTLSGTVIAHGMTIESGATGYSFTGGTGLTLTAGGITAGESITLDTPVTIGGPQSWNVASGRTITVNSPIHTVISTLTLEGMGNVIINGNIDGGGAINTYGGAKPGGLIKANTGSLVLTGTSYDNDFTVQTGTLQVAPAGGAPVAINGGLFGTGSTIINSTGAVSLAGASNYIGTISRASTGALRFLVGDGETATYQGSINGSGDVLHDGAGTTVISGVNSYTGATRIANGALQASSGFGLPSESHLSLEGGVLQSNGTNIFSRSLGTSGETFQWTADGGGFSGGLGSMIVRIGGGTGWLDWGTNVGTQIVGPLKLSSPSARQITDFQNSIRLNGAERTIHVDDNTAFSSEYGKISGVIADGSGPGAIVKTGNGLLYLTANNTFTGGMNVMAGTLRVSNAASLGAAGSSITIYSGAKLEASGGALALDSQTTLTNNGTFAGDLSLAGNALAQGSGTFGAVNVAAGGIFSPGDGVGAVATGAATWNAAGNYLFEISSADGTAGVDWDAWNVAGNLSITSTAFTLAVATLDETSSPGLMADFDSAQAYSWLVASTSGMIDGSIDLMIDTSRFENMPSGHFDLSHVSGQLLYLNYVPHIAGDADGDGVVDDGDAARLAANWGQTGDWTMGDFDHDGRIGPSDAAILAANWGRTAGDEAAPVPEPSTLVLLTGLGLATAMALGRDRERRTGRR